MSRIGSKTRISQQMLIADRGESRINRLAQVASSKSTTQKIIELAWTAGPVTLIASVGGYYLGHGKALPKDTLVFFIAYTVIAGLVGLVAHMVSRLARGQRQEQVEEQLARVIGSLPDLILELRDLHLESLDPELRRLEAARILLQDVELGPRWFAAAVHSVGGSDQLVQAAEQIEMFQRAGMQSRAADICQNHRVELDLLVDSLRNHQPALADSLVARFAGNGFNHKAGIPRGGYFIERVFAAIDDEDDALMTLEDVEDIYTLLFELLSGRRIPVLAFSYAGKSILARETDTLEERRFRYRLVRARAYSRLLALATFLGDRLEGVSLASRSGLTRRDLLTFCNNNIGQVVKRIGQGGADTPALRRILERALDLYHQAYVANSRTDREYRDFVRVVDRWKGHLEDQQAPEVAFYGEGRGKSGLQIVEDMIYLTDRSKLKVVQALSRHFELLKNGSGITTECRMQIAKQHAIRVTLSLDEAIKIRRPEIQRAIYNARSINMGVFERNMSTKAKIGWGEALAKDIEKDMASAAEALAGAIYRFYGVRLDAGSQQQLADRYGVETGCLEAVYRDEATVMHDFLPAQPVAIPRAPLEWRLALTRKQGSRRKSGTVVNSQICN